MKAPRLVSATGVDNPWLDWRFLLLPAFALAICAALINAGGPFFLAANSDSSYAYLVAGLNLSELHRTGELHHPGTPTQVAIALLIRLTYLVIGSGDLSEHVIRHAEIYLRVIQVAFLAAFGGVLHLTGVITRLATGSFGAALLAQCGPLVSMWIQFQMTRPSAEPLLLILGILLQTVMIATLRWKMQDHGRVYVVVLGAILGIGLANKFSLVPLVTATMILCPTWKLRLRLSIATAFFLLLALIPIVFQLREAAILVFGRGLGNRTAWQTALNFFQVLPGAYGVWIAKKFTLAVMLALIAGALAWRAPKNSAARRILWAFLGGFALTAFVCANNPVERFFLPILSIAGAAMTAVWGLLPVVFPTLSPRTQRVALTLLVVSLVGFRAYDGYGWTNTMRRDAAFSLATYETAKELSKRCLVITAYNASSPQGAAFFGNLYGLGIQTSVMEKVHGPHVHLMRFEPNTFTDWRGPISREDLKQRATQGCVAVQGSALNQIEKHFTACNLMPESQNETIHRVFIDDIAPRPSSEREIANACGYRR